MIRDFLERLAYEAKTSPHTIKAYQSDLAQFSTFLQQQYDVKKAEQADFQMIRSWLVSLVELGLENRSINRKMATLRAFYGYLLRNYIISLNPTLKVKALKIEKAPPKYVEEKPMQQLLDEVAFGEGFMGLRDKLVIELLYTTGIRLSELIALTTENTNLYSLQIKVLGKGNKERMIPIIPKTAELLKLYLLEKSNLPKFDKYYLINTDAGEKAYPMFIQRLVKKYLGSVTTLDKKSPHILRHSFATHLLNNGAEINAIKDLLGHATLGATQVYTHNSIQKLKKSYNKAHPKA